jgi:hypothetical protein
MIVILGSSKWPSITFKDSHTIVDDCVSPYLGLWVKSTTDNVQARRVENEDPLVDLRAFYFQKAVPSLSTGSKLIESISDWDIGELMFMMMEKRASASSRAEILFIFVLKVKANVNSNFKRSNDQNNLVFPDIA